MIGNHDRMTFQLTVTDQLGLQSSDTVDVIYFRENIYPVAAAGEDIQTLLGQTKLELLGDLGHIDDRLGRLRLASSDRRMSAMASS